MRNLDFLGTGIQLPFSLEEEEKQDKQKPEAWEWAEAEISIRESIWIILETRPGERLMRPEFGCELSNILFWPNTIKTHEQAVRYVKDALERWEPRIEIKNITASRDEKEDSRINISIEYGMIATNTPFNLTYPFYLEGRG